MQLTRQGKLGELLELARQENPKPLAELMELTRQRALTGQEGLGELDDGVDPLDSLTDKELVLKKSHPLNVRLTDRHLNIVRA